MLPVELGGKNTGAGGVGCFPCNYTSKDVTVPRSGDLKVDFNMTGGSTAGVDWFLQSGEIIFGGSFKGKSGKTG